MAVFIHNYEWVCISSSLTGMFCEKVLRGENNGFKQTALSDEFRNAKYPIGVPKPKIRGS